MAGIYIHIPFCKQACHYCDFHFSTSLAQKEEMIQALMHELDLRKNYLQGQSISSIYFGGGTPSILSVAEIEQILSAVQANFELEQNIEITLEANPDDISLQKAIDWRKAGINRLSIGIQSFDEEILKWMNRAHSAKEALQAMENVRLAGFENISIDLIYGVPQATHEKWREDLALAMQFKPEHISSYCLTIEEKTAFGNWVRKGKMRKPEDDFAAAQYEMLIETLSQNGYEQYEVSNFCHSENYSRHNSSYWLQQNYLGIGPSAHSYDGESRQWNISNNSKYLKALQSGADYFQKEILSESDKVNDYLLTALRTRWGLDYEKLKTEFQLAADWPGWEYLATLTAQKLAEPTEKGIRLSSSGRLMADAITSKLFVD
jgi:oxygen-independent coproporphyrinogen III oxidase